MPLRDAVTERWLARLSVPLEDHPAHAEEWADPRLDDHLEAVLDLLLDGLRTRP